MQSSGEILAKIEAERRRLTADYQEQMDRLDAAAKAIEQAFGVLPAEARAQLPQTARAVRASLVGVKSTKEALLVLARESPTGIVHTKEASMRLLDAGLIKGGNNAKGRERGAQDAVGSALRRMTEFEKVGEATWRLKGR